MADYSTTNEIAFFVTIGGALSTVIEGDQGHDYEDKIEQQTVGVVD